MISFENTEVAFSDKTTSQLRKAYWMFWLVKNPWLVKLGSHLLRIANAIRFPLRWVLGPTVFAHFCAGETLEQCQETVNKLSVRNVKGVLDYAAEGVEKEQEFEEATQRILATIQQAQESEDIAFAVFKFTGIARFAILEKVSADATLTPAEEAEFLRVKQRALRICEAARQAGVPVMIDAEESWIQKAVDELVEEFMQEFNTKIPVVYHTLQMYRVDKLYDLKRIASNGKEKGYFPGFKLVRGAYMEKERERAARLNYASPIHPDKHATDQAFDEGVKFCLENIWNLGLVVGTHNEKSCQEAMYLMDVAELDRALPGIYFSQLLGMSDHISFNMAGQGYNVAKYLPYGPLRLVMPYLIRRAEENTSVAGQTGRELFLLKKELKRRKLASA